METAPVKDKHERESINFVVEKIGYQEGAGNLRLVGLHLQGYFTSEIARMTAHDPVNVDRYIQDFQRILEFAQEQSPIERVAFYTGAGHRLIKEYLEIIKEHGLADPEYMDKVLSGKL